LVVALLYKLALAVVARVSIFIFSQRACDSKAKIVTITYPS